MKTLGQFIMLPTQSVSQVYIIKETLCTEEYPCQSVRVGNQHLYVVSHDKNVDEIKAGDHFELYGKIEKCHRIINKHEIAYDYDGRTYQQQDKIFCKKIIYSTDKSVSELIPYDKLLWITEYYNKHNKAFPTVLYDEMEDPTSLFQSDEEDNSGFTKYQQLLDIIVDTQRRTINLKESAEKIFQLFNEEIPTPTETEKEDAAIMITLRNATIQVISVGPEKELLHEVINAPKGSWDKIWAAIKSIKSVKK